MKELIIAAAWLDPRTGIVYQGNDHAECWWNASQDDPDWPHKSDAAHCWADWLMHEIGVEVFYQAEGFLTNTKRFVDRDEALEIAKRSRQVDKQASNGLRAEEMYD